MPGSSIKNGVLAGMFERMADILEIQGENVFKVNAYRKAARVIGDLSEDVAALRQDGRLNDLPGVGDALAKKIIEFLDTGRIAKYEELAGSVPDGLMDLLKIPGLGPKTLILANKKLDVKNMADLKKVVEDGRLSGLPGMGEKKADNIRRGIELIERHAGRIPLGVALPVAESVIAELRKRTKGIGRMVYAGSLRRMQETMGDIDILVETDQGSEAVDAFTALTMVTQVLAKGDTKGSIIVGGGLQIDMRAVPKESYGAALQYFTGSKAHNVRVREIAKKLGYKINEYGIFRDEKRIGGKTEEEIYEKIGMAWIPPELREDGGEIEAAIENRLPELIESGGILGDLHVHTIWSDGSADIETMARKAEALGYRYLAICDHSRSASDAGGLSPERLLEQIKEIWRVNGKLKKLRLLAGTEADIRSDGSMDFPDDLLGQLDIVVASVHSGFRQRVTERLIAAAKHPLVTIIGHPTGRLIGEREGYEVDVEAVMKACSETGTAMEINAYYLRLDLNDVLSRRAKELGIRLSLGTDAHHPDQMDMMRYGLTVARRAWLERKDVLNCLGIKEILKKRKFSR